MKRLLLPLVLLLFLSALFLINWYVLSRFALFFGGAPSWLPWLALATSLSYLIATVAESSIGNRLTSRLYTATAIWLGAAWLLVIPFALADLSMFVPALRETGIAPHALALFIGLWLIVYAYANGNRFETRHIRLTSTKRTKPLRIAHLSDLHIGPAHRRGYLRRVVAAVNHATPDLVCITGDLIDQPGTLTPELLAPLKRLTAPVYYTLGNHEHYVGVKKVKELLRGSPLTLLEDASAVHGTGRDAVTLLGVSDSEDRQQVATTLPQLSFSTERFTLLLYHRPDGLEAAARHGVDLMLCGHTHTGQLWPFTYLVKLRFPRLHGLFTHGPTTLSVSPGTGTWGPPMRLGSRSVITLLDVRPKQ